MTAIADIDRATHEGEHDAIPATDQPWRHWLGQLRFPHSSHDQVEADVETGMRAADARRLQVVPSTARFADAWDQFRHTHGRLEGCALHRRLRFQIWRAAALKVALSHVHDAADAKQVYDKLAATMDDFGGAGAFNAHGDYAGGNLWRPHDDHPLSEYAALVLSLNRAAEAQQ